MALIEFDIHEADENLLLDILDELHDSEIGTERALRAILQQTILTHRKVNAIMTDVSKLNDAVSRLSADVAETITLLTNITAGDPAVQAVIDDAVSKLSAAADALEAADASAEPTPAPAPEPTPEPQPEPEPSA